MSRNPTSPAAMGNLFARIRERLDGSVRRHMEAMRGDIKAVSLKVREQTRQLVRGMNVNSDFIYRVSQLINQVTGYETCERLKRSVQEADRDFQRLKDELHRARSTFDLAIQNRSQCQKDINSLLQRKQSWSDEELHRFTELYRKEMRLEQGEAEAKASHQQLEAAVDRSHQKLMDALRERYQEEQLWSDKIRRVSTYGTISLMVLNLVLFLIIQLVLEPRKRQRLLGRFDAMLEAKLETINTHLKEQGIRGQAQPVPILDPGRSRGIKFPATIEERTAQMTIIGLGLILAFVFGRWMAP